MQKLQKCIHDICMSFFFFFRCWDIIENSDSFWWIIKTPILASILVRFLLSPTVSDMTCILYFCAFIYFMFLYFKLCFFFSIFVLFKCFYFYIFFIIQYFLCFSAFFFNVFFIVNAFIFVFSIYFNIFSVFHILYSTFSFYIIFFLYFLYFFIYLYSLVFLYILSIFLLTKSDQIHICEQAPNNYCKNFIAINL